MATQHIRSRNTIVRRPTVVSIFAIGFKDEVNSTAAVQVRPYTGNCMFYPFVTLMEAAARSTSQPPAFLQDCAGSTMLSAVNKLLVVNMGRYACKNRWWLVCTANIGDGKSEAQQIQRDCMLKTMQNVGSQYTVVDRADRYRYQQGGTNGSAVDRLRSCDGYLGIFCSEAAHVLAPGQARGNPPDEGNHIGITKFLDAAHGNDFSHQNMKQGEAFNKHKKKGSPHPQDAVVNPPRVHIADTNVVVQLMQQDVVFMDW